MEKKPTKLKSLSDMYADKLKKTGVKREQDSPESSAQDSPPKEPGMEEQVVSRRPGKVEEPIIKQEGIKEEEPPVERVEVAIDTAEAPGAIPSGEYYEEIIDPDEPLEYVAVEEEAAEELSKDHEPGVSVSEVAGADKTSAADVVSVERPKRKMVVVVVACMLVLLASVIIVVSWLIVSRRGDTDEKVPARGNESGQVTEPELSEQPGTRAAEPTLGAEGAAEAAPQETTTGTSEETGEVGVQEKERVEETIPVPTAAEDEKHPSKADKTSTVGKKPGKKNGKASPSKKAKSKKGKKVKGEEWEILL